MTKLIITTGNDADFFKRGRRVAQAADQGETMADEHVLSFEDPSDMMRLITEARLALFRAVKDEPGSITAIAERLHRDRSAVKRDVDILQAAGMVTVDEKVLPGHGRMREVRATAQRLSLQAEVA
ncbi:helix-turn-helix domain-containing protein [Thiomonas intermedia]|uniref:HVO_A0114 family putative DNA-binding protein n=1 Tax=Thiomonas intermedia TaxID=926 RepID=UPI0009A4A9E6|nr:helix-turn-helix domain-containing protein [Thiomonas intermedia]